MNQRTIVALATVAGAVLSGAQAATQQASIPTFQVDPYFPKPLPNAWTFGWVAAVFVDARDHIWLLHVPGSLSQWEDGAGTDPPRSLCCKAAPPVVEFDQDGNVVQSWGGPGQGYDWPATEHALYIDWKSNYLGPRYADYCRSAMWRCAARQHYLLQIHLYLVALRRYLRLYGSGTQAVSGSLLFLRGVLPDAGQGVLEITPSEALLNDLDGLFVSAVSPVNEAPV